MLRTPYLGLKVLELVQITSSYFYSRARVFPVQFSVLQTLLLAANEKQQRGNMATPKIEYKPDNTTHSILNHYWWLGLFQGILAVFFGITAIFWPGLTLVALVYLFSAFVLAWGIIEIINGFLQIGHRSSWVLTLLFGILGLAAGIYLVRHPGVSFTALIIVIGLLLIARGILDIVGIFLDKKSGGHKALMGIVGVAALAAGIIILFQPVSGGVAFVWVLGLYALVYGALTIALAVQMHQLTLPPDDLHDKRP